MCENLAVPPVDAPDLADYTPLQKLQVEEYILGMTPSANPMSVYRPLIEAQFGSEAGTGSGALSVKAPDPLRPAPLCLMRDLPRHAAGRVTVAGVLFAERRARTKDGQFMKFISLEDETGVVEAVLLPDAYQRLGGRITTRGPYIVTGMVEDHMGAISLMVSDLRLFETSAEPQEIGAA